jgi:hypothetical protein
VRSLIVANADVIFVNQDVRTPSPPKVVGIPGRVTKSCMVVNETVASPALVHGETPARPPELAVDAPMFILRHLFGHYTSPSPSIPPISDNLKLGAIGVVGGLSTYRARRKRAQYITKT